MQASPRKWALEPILIFATRNCLATKLSRTMEKKTFVRCVAKTYKPFSRKNRLVFSIATIFMHYLTDKLAILKVSALPWHGHVLYLKIPNAVPQFDKTNPNALSTRFRIRIRKNQQIPKICGSTKTGYTKSQ